MKWFGIFISMAFFFCAGILITWKSTEFPFYAAYTISEKSLRDPAAIKKVYDFSQLDGSALNYAAKQRILDGAKVIRQNSDLGVELGHFVVKGPDGLKAFACQRYSQIILQFEGEGMAIAGEAPQMEVEGACEISQDINSIAAVWIPVARILGEQVADGEFDYRDGKPARVRFANVSDQWPKSWYLKGVRLVDPSGATSEVSVSYQEIKSILGNPFVIQFQ